MWSCSRGFPRWATESCPEADCLELPLWTADPALSHYAVLVWVRSLPTYVKCIYQNVCFHVCESEILLDEGRETLLWWAVSFTCILTHKKRTLIAEHKNIIKPIPDLWHVARRLSRVDWVCNLDPIFIAAIVEAALWYDHVDVIVDVVITLLVVLVIVIVVIIFIVGFFVLEVIVVS